MDRELEDPRLAYGQLQVSLQLISVGNWGSK